MKMLPNNNMENNTPATKKIWREPTLVLISTNDVTVKHLPAHHESTILPHKGPNGTSSVYFTPAHGVSFGAKTAHSFIS